MPFEQKRYTQLRKILLRWVHRDLDGAKDLLGEIDALGSKTAKLAMLEDRVAKKPKADGFNPSPGHSVGDRTALVKLQVSCIRKTMRSGTQACKNTLFIYGQLRAQGLEDEAPIARCFKVETTNGMTHFLCEYLGQDAVKDRRVTQKEFARLRNESMDELCGYGIARSSIDSVAKNWCVVRSPGRGWRAVLVDLGGIRWPGASLKKKKP
jgi:hypothetical protein